MRSRYIFAALFVLVIFATPLSLCIAGGTRGEEKYNIVKDLTQEGWDFKIGESLHDLRQVGLVVREVTTVVNNIHVENQKDEIRELFFDGLYIRAYFPARDHSFLLLQIVEITKESFKIKHGLNLGVSISKVRSVLGDPDEVKDEVYTYHDDPVLQHSTVYFFIKKGMIDKVRWEFYVD